MKTKFKLVLWIALVSYSVLFTGCSKSSDPVKGKYQTGVLIANEGAFGSANGDVTYYNASSSLIRANHLQKCERHFSWGRPSESDHN